jgi:hypothetical protein
MPLQVLLVQNNSTPGEIVAELDDSGEYWFLAKFWPASSTNGKIIDLYDDAVFAGANLKQLDDALGRAAEAIATKRSEWDQVVGAKPDGTKVLRKVRRASVASLVTTLRKAVAEAEVRRCEVHFSGD